jgi:hypothetical protein
LTLVGCGDPSAPFELADESAFAGAFGPHVGRAFDVVAADMDADGDPDVLVNWHHLGPMELFENRQGRFVLVEASASGLFDNVGIASLYADSAEMTARIEASDAAGLYVWHDWHDLARRASWQFLWKDDTRRHSGFVLDLLTSLDVLEVRGLEPKEVEQETGRTRRIHVEGPSQRRAFSVRTLPATRLLLDLRDPAGNPIAIFVGRELTPRSDGRLDVWQADPHGIAWVDVEGSPRPELFITRGGLSGKLLPPLEPKRDRYFRPAPASAALYELDGASAIPRDHGRGRQVEWVDIDNDGCLELSVANEFTPNRLLARTERAGPFREAAADLGLDLERAEVQCWGDHDGDGFQDLYFLEDHTIHLLLNQGGRRFERVPGESLGLTIPPSDQPSSRQFDFAALRLADFDNDGELDLWLLGFGEDLTNHLFRRSGVGFEDVSERVGMRSVHGSITAVLLDVDNDGFEDVVSSGFLDGETKQDVGRKAGTGHVLVWFNRGGKSFTFDRLPLRVAPGPIHVATSLDADGDGRQDVVAVGLDRYLLLNRSDAGHSFLDVTLRDRGRPPIGALVRVFYADGRVAARRLGSARSSAFSQVAGALHFGIPAGMQVLKIAVRWPGEPEDSLYAAPASERTLLIERGVQF